MACYLTLALPDEDQWEYLSLHEFEVDDFAASVEHVKATLATRSQY